MYPSEALSAPASETLPPVTTTASCATAPLISSASVAPALSVKPLEIVSAPTPPEPGEIVAPLAAVSFPVTAPPPENVFPFPTANPAGFADTLNVAPPATSTDGTLLSVPLAPSASVPELMLTAPVVVLLPFSVSVPEPA